MKKLWIFCCICLTFSYNLYSQNDEFVIEPTIELEQIEDIITLQPIIQNHSSLNLEFNYLLLVKKLDQNSNLSITKQSGKFALEPHEIKKLGTSKVNIQPKQNINAILYIRNEFENKLIAKDSIQINCNQLSKVEETSLFLDGMVVDESKTKFGKEFYDVFFSQYNQYPKKYNFIIVISELPYRGQTSIIQIQIDQETVYEFYSNPNEEYAKHQVNMALKNIDKYAETLQNINKEFPY